MRSDWRCVIGTSPSADRAARNPRSRRTPPVASPQFPVERDMASMRVGRKWFKKAKRTRLPRLDSIPRRDPASSARRGRSPETEITVDLDEQPEPSGP